MERPQLFAVFFFVAFLFLLYQFYHVFQFFLVPLSWAALLALIFYPAYTLLVRALRGREGFAAFLFTTLIILTVIVPTIYLSLLLAWESVALVQHLREAHESGQLLQLVEKLRVSPLGNLWERLTPQLATWKIDPAAIALKASNAISTFLVAQAGGAAANVLRFIANFFLTTFALLFFFRDGERMVHGFRNLLPMEPAHKDAILGRLYETLSAVVQGTLATAAAQGALAGLGFWIFSVPFALTLGFATALLSLIPLAGPLVWMGAVAYLVVTTEYVRAVLLFLWGVLIVGTADNVIRPWVIGGRTRIPTVFLFFAILGGLRAYGFLGVFLGPALIATLVAFIRIYREEYALDAEHPPTASPPPSD